MSISNYQPTAAPLPAESDAESTVSENPQAKSESVEAQDEVLGDAPDVADEEDEEEGDEEVSVVSRFHSTYLVHANQECTATL